MQFVVPQFIDVEDKVIGPISVRQFIIILIGAIAVFLDYELIFRLNNNFWVFLAGAVVILVLTTLFAFVKVNGRPFHYFVISIIVTLREPRLRIWSKEVSLYELRQKDLPTETVTVVPPKRQLTASKLALLSLVVDTGGAFRESPENPESSVIHVARKRTTL